MKSIISILFLLATCFLFSQNGNKKTLLELVYNEDPAIKLVTNWAKNATIKVEILEKNTTDADENLLWAQVSTRSPMGAIIYQTGGLIIENGLLRIYGSGNQKLDRSIKNWNIGRANFTNNIPNYIVVADDVFGGFYAINGGYFDSNNLGKIYYLSPDNLQWENLDLSYSDFLIFSFSSKINEFYKAFKWKNFDSDFKLATNNQAFYFYPFLFTIEGKDIEKAEKKLVPIEEIWKLYNNLQK